MNINERAYPVYCRYFVLPVSLADKQKKVQCIGDQREASTLTTRHEPTNLVCFLDFEFPPHGSLLGGGGG